MRKTHSHIDTIKLKLPRRLTGLFSLVAILCLFANSGFAQRKGRKIQILGANDLIFQGEGKNKAKKLIGNVRIKHGSTHMNCDSAFVYGKSNTMKAYGNVHIYDKDSLEIHGDSLRYYGAKKLAQIRGRIVTLKQGDMHLTTQFIDYDRKNGVGKYWNGGNILLNEGKDSLYSGIGYYYMNSSDMEFKDSVRLRTIDYKIESDTLHYNSATGVSKFYGPTYIRSDSNLIYTEKGWSNTKKKISSFSKNSYILSKEQQLYGDSIYYDQNVGLGESFGNVKLIDTLNNFMVEGDYVYYHQKDSVSLVLGDPMLTQFFKNDSLYLHADTLYSHYDTSGKYRMIHAYPQAQFYKSDLQGKSDSLVFSDVNSSIRLYKNPIIWSENNQITAKLITIFKSGDEIDRMHMDYRAFIGSLEDSTGQYKKYNQIKGDSMIGLFDSNKLKQVNVLHNGKTIYFAKQDDGRYIGMNKAESENMSIYLDSNAVSRIIFRKQPVATLYPIKDVTPRMQFLKRFKWRGNERPIRREDIFNWKEEEETEGD